MLHLTFSTCGADYASSIFIGVNLQCVADVEISNIVVSNSTGFGLYALNIVGFVHIQNSVFIYNTGYIGGNTACVNVKDFSLVRAGFANAQLTG